MIEDMIRRANEDTILVGHGRYIDLTFELAIGDTAWLIQVERGQVSARRKSGALDSKPAFSLRADTAAWDDFAKPVPPPCWHDILGLYEGARLEMDGDILTLMRNLFYVKLLLEKMRATGAEA